MKANLDVRQAAASKGVFLWEIGAAKKMHDCNFSRLLRRELSDQEKQEIYRIIDEIANAREGKV